MVTLAINARGTHRLKWRQFHARRKPGRSMKYKRLRASRKEGKWLTVLKPKLVNVSSMNLLNYKVQRSVKVCWLGWGELCIFCWSIVFCMGEATWSDLPSNGITFKTEQLTSTAVLGAMRSREWAKPSRGWEHEEEPSDPRQAPSLLSPLACLPVSYLWPLKLSLMYEESLMYEGGERVIFFFLACLVSWFFFSLGMYTFILNINKGEVKNTRSI